jgi:ABC-2 type transport system permease protein
LRVISTINPVTYATDAARALALARPPGWSILAAITIAGVAGLLGARIASRTFKSHTG